MILKHNAFSLVELSIVLVILGLLTGGILTGQNLIKSSQLRAVTTEYSQFQIAINTFEEKYFALPGDMTNATSFWGDNNTHCPDAAIANGTPGTCNGNGDNIVQQLAAGAGQESEGYMFWLQLAQAGLIAGEYTGIAGPNATDDDLLNVNVPASKFPKAGWNVENYNIGDTVSFDIPYGNKIFEFGADDPMADSDMRVLTPEEAWNIDKKIDDGQPAYGNVVGKYWNNDCTSANDGTSANNDLDASYLLSIQEVRCSLSFLNAF